MLLTDAVDAVDAAPLSSTTSVPLSSTTSAAAYVDAG